MTLSEDDLRRRLHEAVALLPPPDHRLPEPHGPQRINHRRILAVAAAVIVVIALSTIVLVVHRHSDRSAPVNRPTTGITCVGDSDVAGDVAPVRARLKALGVKDAVVSASGTTLTIDSTAARSTLEQACASGGADFRPVIAAVAHASTTATKTPAVPTSVGAYEALSPSARNALLHTLSTTPCSQRMNPPSAKTAIACTTGEHPLTLLLAPAVVGSRHITRATAIAPGQTTAQWTVAVDLDAAGTAAWATYTAAHNIAKLPYSAANTLADCSASTTPCQDYVAVVVGGEAISVPVTNEEISGGTTQISGSFTETSARTLAAVITAQLPVPLRTN